MCHREYQVKTTGRIRAAKPSEAALLSNLAFRSKKHWGYSDAFMENCRKELTYGSAHVSDQLYEVLEANGSIVGFYALIPSPDGSIELEALFVEPAMMKRGFGRQLFERAVMQTRSLGAASLVIQSDPNAAPFYAAMGAKQVGQRESVSIPGRYLPVYVYDVGEHVSA